MKKIEKQAKEYLKKSMSKKALAEHNKANRGVSEINTATRTFRSVKDYNRQAVNMELRKAMQMYI